MYDEVELRMWVKQGSYEAVVDKQEEAVNDALENNVSFHRDSWNLDLSESEVEITQKKKRRIIFPPNPHYRIRKKKRRYSVLSVWSHFKV